MNLEQALKKLGLTAESSQSDTMQAYVELAKPAAGRTEIQEAFKIVTADWTVADFMSHYSACIPPRLRLRSFNFLIAGTKKLDEEGMLFLHIPVDEDTLGIDPMNFNSVLLQARAGRWIITSDANNTSSSGIPPHSKPEYLQVFQSLQLGFHTDTAFNRIPNARMIHGFIRYAFEGITPRQIINVILDCKEFSELVPYLSSVTTDRLSDVSPHHYRVLLDLRNRLYTDPSLEARGQIASDIRDYIATHLTGAGYTVDTEEVTTQYSPEDIALIQFGKGAPSLASAPNRLFSRAAAERSPAPTEIPCRISSLAPEDDEEEITPNAPQYV